MKCKWVWVGLAFLIGGLVGCSDDVESKTPETDIGWSDVEDVGGSEDGSDSLADVGDTGGDEQDVGPPPEPATGRSWVVAHSVRERPIVAEEFGESGPIVYLMSAIHGSERAAVTFGERFRVPLLGGLAEQAGVRVFYLAAANPDGIAAKTRHNAANIDLNRNFPSDNFDSGGTGGRAPLSEPESIVIHDTVAALDPVALISVHCCVGLIDWDGPGESLASRMATAAGFPADRLGGMKGSLGSWAGGDLRIPTITVEFDVHEAVDTAEQLENMEVATGLAMDWAYEEAEAVQEFSIYEAVLPKKAAGFVAFDVGLSAGNLVIRGERLGEETEKPVLVIAGVDASDHNALYVAEHIRRVLISEHSTRDAQVTIVTAANPDAILMRSSLNADGDDVAVDFGAAPARTPEARAIRELLAAQDFGMVILVEGDAGGDRIESFGLTVDAVEAIVGEGLQVVAGDAQGFAEGSLVRSLVEQDVPVLRFAVTTKFAVGDTRTGHVFEDIGVFSKAASQLVQRR